MKKEFEDMKRNNKNNPSGNKDTDCDVNVGGGQKQLHKQAQSQSQSKDQMSSNLDDLSRKLNRLEKSSGYTDATVSELVCEFGLLKELVESSSDHQAGKSIDREVASPTAGSNTKKPLEELSVDQVCKLMISLSLPTAVDHVRANTISGRFLPHMTQQDFIDHLKLLPFQANALYKVMQEYNVTGVPVRNII
jgi:hypothetical protein